MTKASPVASEYPQRPPTSPGGTSGCAGNGRPDERIEGRFRQDHRRLPDQPCCDAGEACDDNHERHNEHDGVIEIQRPSAVDTTATDAIGTALNTRHHRPVERPACAAAAETAARFADAALELGKMAGQQLTRPYTAEALAGGLAALYMSGILGALVIGATGAAVVLAICATGKSVPFICPNVGTVPGQ